MPYITKDRREFLDAGADPLTPGEVNYLITRALDRYIKRHGINYTTLNAAVGALGCAEHELYRRVIEPYEAHKELQNGDVYTCLQPEEE